MHTYRTKKAPPRHCALLSVSHVEPTYVCGRGFMFTLLGYSQYEVVIDSRAILVVVRVAAGKPWLPVRRTDTVPPLGMFPLPLTDRGVIELKEKSDIMSPYFDGKPSDTTYVQ